MSIHDDAEAARREVYDAALAEKENQILELSADIAEIGVELNKAVADLSKANADIEEYVVRLEEVNLELDEARRQVSALTAEVAELQDRIRELENQQPDPEDGRKPVRFATLEEAISALGAPTDARYVVWKPEWTHLEQAHASMSDTDILVLPERPEPYLIDTSKGFMASGVSAVDGPNGTRTPVVSNSRLWFAMTRARRGIIAMGPGAVIALSDSSWSAPRQPLPQYSYNAQGTRGSAPLSGAQNTLIECWVRNSFFGNLTIQARDLGGVAYSTLKITNPDNNSKVTIRRFFADGAWRGHDGKPNGETGAIVVSKGGYDIEGAFLDAKGEGPSPIMWNNCDAGGRLANVGMTRPNHGMLTHWYSGGTHSWDNVDILGNAVGMNLEQTDAGFTLNITDGSIDIPEGTSGYHINGNPVNGSWKINITGTEFIGGRDPNKCNVHNYAPSARQRKSDIKVDSPVVFWGSYVD